MTSSRLRILFSFVSGAVFMWFTMMMVAQQAFIFKTHQSTLKFGNQELGLIQGKDVHLPLRASKLDPKRDTRSISNSEKKSPNDVTQRTQKVRLLCWVMTSPTTLETKAAAVARTWAKKCSQTLFMSSQKNTNFSGNVVGLDVREGRYALWNKTMSSLKYLYDHHFNDADWFFKADDDTYVVVENLKAFLSEQDPTEPVYFGFNFAVMMKFFGFKLNRVDYMSGGAGYAMSREALRRFVEVGLEDRTGKCPNSRFEWPEDMNLGMCLESLGVRPGDTRDRFGRFRFIPTNLGYFVDDSTNPLDWLHEYSKYNVSRGHECCSDSLISFHYVQPEEMLLFDFLINHVNVGLFDG